jgi:hypothetical protein
MRSALLSWGIFCFALSGGIDGGILDSSGLFILSSLMGVIYLDYFRECFVYRTDISIGHLLLLYTPSRTSNRDKTQIYFISGKIFF